MVAEAEAAHDVIQKVNSLQGLGYALAYQGEVGAARGAADAVLERAELGEMVAGIGNATLAVAALAAGNVETAQDASEMAWQYLSGQPQTAAVWRANRAEVALANGDLIEAGRWADDAVTDATGWHLVVALTTRAHVAIAQGEPERAGRDAHDALTQCGDLEVRLVIPDILECLAEIAHDAGSHHQAARLFGAAEAIRQRIGVVRFKVYNAGYDASRAVLRDAMDEKDFQDAWAEGAALTTEEAIGYAQRGRGERKRASSGWESLTPAELDVVRLVTEGLGNKDIAARLFLSPRTVQAHLTHVYTKLGLTSRVQLAQEAARRGEPTSVSPRNESPHQTKR